MPLACSGTPSAFGVQQWAGGSSRYPPRIGRINATVCPGSSSCGRSAPHAVSLHCQWQCPDHGHLHSALVACAGGNCRYPLHIGRTNVSVGLGDLPALERRWYLGRILHPPVGGYEFPNATSPPGWPWYLRTHSPPSHLGGYEFPERYRHLGTKLCT